MDFSPEIPQPQDNQAESSKLQVDFTWKKFRALITEANNSSDPIYIVHFQTIKCPHLIIKSATDDSTIGTGTLHPISINADYEIRGQKHKLKALKRFRTKYTHLSEAFSEDGSPATMTWTCGCSWKTWDFICLDEQQTPVAKFSANAWSVRKVGNIEFMGPKAASPAVRDEIVVTGLTLFYCMLLRSSSILSFFGAIFARPGPLDGKEATESKQEGLGGEVKDMGYMSHQEIIVNKS